MEDRLSEMDQESYESRFKKKASEKEDQQLVLPSSLSPAEGKEDVPLGEAFIRGAKEEVIPFATSKEEIEKRKAEDQSFGSLAAETAGSILSGVAAASTAARLGGAAGAAIAGPLGGVVGAGVGALGYALYSGFGQEYLQSEIAGQESSTARALARTALQINPAARIGGEAAAILGQRAPKAILALKKAQEKTSTAVARGVAQVAGETAVAGSTYGEDAAAASAAMSTLLSPLIFSRLKGAPTPREVESFHEAIGEKVGLGILEKAQPEINKALKKPVTRKQLSSPAFMEYVLSRPGKLGPGKVLEEMDARDKEKAFKDLLAVSKMTEDGKLIQKGGITREALIDMYRGYKTRNILLKHVKDANQEMMSDVAKNLSSEDASKTTELMDAFGDTFKWFADGQYIGRALDRKLGFNYTTQLNNLSETNNKFEVAKIGLYKKILDAQKKEKSLFKSLGKDFAANKKEGSENLARLRIFISEGDESYLTPKLRQYVDIENRTITNPAIQETMLAWDDFFETARDVINSTGYFVPKVDNYLTRKTLKDTDLAISIQRSMQDLKRYAMAARVDDIFDLSADKLKKIGVVGDKADEVMKDVQSLLDMTTTRLKLDEEVTEENVAKLVKDLISSGKSRMGLGYELSAVMTRKGGNIAPRFRDLDISSVAMRYIESNIRNAFFSKQYTKLSDSLDIVRSAGLSNAADWMQDHLDDVVGGGLNGKTKVSNMVLSGAEKLKFRANMFFQNTKFEDTVVQKAVEGIPEFLGKWQSMIYPSYLGLNVRAHLRDYGQVLLKSAPELGGWYGYKTAFKGYVNALKDARDENGKFSIRALRDDLRAKGILGTSNITAEAIRDYGAKSIPGAGLYRQTNETLMAIYSVGDMTNRAVTYKMGGQFARDLMEGDKAALDAFRNLGSAARSNLQAAGLRQAIDAGDIAKAEDILGKWLVAKTQFHYGIEQKAKYARFMGPLFSMFTKWPTSIGSEIVDIWRENPGAYRKMQRYSQLYAAPLMALMGIDYAVTEEFGGREDGAYAYLVGSAAQASPLNSLEFTLFQNPTLEMLDYVAGSAKKVMEDPSMDTAGAAGKNIIKRVSKQGLGAVSAIINEIERYEKRYLGESDTTIDEALSNIFGE